MVSPERARHPVHNDECGAKERKVLTFSIALLVRPPLDSFLTLLALGIDTFLGDAVANAAEAGAGVVAFLARILAIGAGVLDLATLGAGRLGGREARRERVHVHRHARRVRDGVHRHLWLDGVGGGRGRGRLLVLVGVGLGVGITHRGERGEVEGGERGIRGH